MPTLIPCTEADFENRPCARENCAKLVRRALATDPRKLVRKMCGGIQQCAEIVRNLCRGAPAQFAQNKGWGASENVRAQISRNFSVEFEFFADAKLYRRKVCQSLGYQNQSFPGVKKGGLRGR